MNKTEKGLYILLEQVRQGKYKVKDGELYDSKGRKLGSVKKNGYKRYYVRNGDFKCSVYAHRFMYLYYYGHIDPEMTINHKNGNKLDNRKENLEEVTRSENTKHSFEVGLQSSVGSNNPFSKLTEEDVKKIKELLRAKRYKQKEIAKMFNVSPSNIRSIKKGISWGHVS